MLVAAPLVKWGEDKYGSNGPIIGVGGSGPLLKFRRVNKEYVATTVSLRARVKRSFWIDVMGCSETPEGDLVSNEVPIHS